jgi:hypothetical protein
MMQRSSLLYLLVIAGLLLSGCSSGGGPAIDATRAWFQALANLDFDGVMKLTCANTRVRDEIGAKLDPFIDLKEELAALKGQFDFSGLKFEEKSNDGQTATIHLSGKMVLRALGQSEPLDVFEDLTLVRENDTWKVCGNPLNTP